MIKKLRQYLARLHHIHDRISDLQLAVGRIEARQTAGAETLREAEFKVSSQWGEDGIVQYLLRRIPIDHPLFIEFGVQDYRESNTRYLLQNDNWAGLVMDGSPDNVQAIKQDPIYWRHNLKAVCAFIDRDNINQLMQENGVSGDIGLLSVDIDGNDYWVWEAINVVSARIVVAEYNSLFGPTAKVTVPYDPTFQRTNAHYSNLYWGASLPALTELAERKGYVLVGSNSAGNNAFFVRKNVAARVMAISAAEAWVQAAFRESRNAAGELTFLAPAAAKALIADMPIWDIERSELMPIADALA